MIPADVIERARAVRIEDLLGKLGKELPGKKTKRNGPCPKCGGTDRFSIDTKKQVWFCRHCAKGGGIIDLVKNIDGCDFREAVEKLSGERIEQQDTKRAQPRQRDDAHESAAYEKRQSEKAQYLWLQRWPIAGSPAERYLREARGYCGPLPATLGFLQPSKPGHHPAMIAAFAVCDEPEPGVVGEPRGVTSKPLMMFWNMQNDIASPTSLRTSPRLYKTSPGDVGDAVTCTCRGVVADFS